MRIIIVALVFVMYVILFKKAAGTLKITKLNMISVVFFSMLFFQLIGGSIVYLGYRDHYLIQKISNPETIDKTYYILVYTVLMLPLCIIIFNKLIFKIGTFGIWDKENTIENKYNNKIEEKVDLLDSKKQKRLFTILVILTIICLLSIIYVFVYIKYIPLLKYFNTDIDLDVERVNISRNFQGNQYIKNLIMLTITPVISYIAYIYMRKTKESKWKILFGLLFFMSILALTYNFEKAPSIFYLLFFFIIEIVIGKKFNLKNMLPIAIVPCILILILYKFVFGYEGEIFSISSGPIGRVIMTQVATLFLHVDAYPNNIPYLNGHSFPKEMTLFIGEGEYSVRSGRQVMEFYSQYAVENGTAGVMSTIFVGEAYANFGMIGVIIAPVIAGLIFSSVYCLFLKSKKDVLNIVLYVEAISIFKDVLQGGFVDFFYNIKLFTVLIVIFMIKKLIDYDKIWK